jgi:hypothetical protein
MLRNIVGQMRAEAFLADLTKQFLCTPGGPAKAQHLL